MPGIKILIVEDESVLAKVLQEKLEEGGYCRTEIASDGEVAMSLARSFQPSLVLLDIVLPRKTGLEVLGELKADHRLKTIPVVILTNLYQDEDIKGALRMGADDYIVKTQHPINEVVDKIKERLLFA